MVGSKNGAFLDVAGRNLAQRNELEILQFDAFKITIISISHISIH